MTTSYNQIDTLSLFFMGSQLIPLFQSNYGYDKKCGRGMKNKSDLYLWLITNLKQHAKEAVSNSSWQGLMDFSIRLVDLDHV